MKSLRFFLQTVWRDFGRVHGYKDAESGHGMCHFTAAFLVKALPVLTGEADQWRINGGHQHFFDDGDSGGFFDGQSWRAHQWVTNGKIIVDLTASQFGEEDILIVDANDPRYLDTSSKPENISLVKVANMHAVKVADEWFQQWTSVLNNHESKINNSFDF